MEPRPTADSSDQATLSTPAPTSAPTATPAASEASPPRTPPTDPDVERARLIVDAEAHGIDPKAAIDVAASLQHTLPEPDALRAVDRRIASGMSLEDAKRTLVDELT